MKTDHEKLTPYSLPLSVESPQIYAMMMSNPSDAAIDRGIFFEPPATLNPEQSLCAAMLEQACNDFTNQLVKARDYQEAREWIFECQDDSLFSFIYVCESLNINPSYMRQILRRREPGARIYKAVSAHEVTLKRVTPEQRAEVLELLQTTMVMRDIAAKVKLSFESIRTIGIQEMGATAWRQRALNVLSVVRRKRRDS